MKRIPPFRYIAAFAFAVAVLLLKFFLYGPLKNIERSEGVLQSYKGVVKIWDGPTATVKGSKYGFIETICGEFSDNFNALRMELYKIPSASDGKAVADSIAAGASPDVIRSNIDGFDALSGNVLVSSEEYTSELNSLYDKSMTNGYSDKLVVDVHCNASVIIVNTDLLGEIGISFPGEKLGKEEFAAFLEEIYIKAEGKYNVLGLKNDEKYIFPFSLVDGKENLNPDYFKSIEKYANTNSSDSKDSDALYAFYSGKTAVFCGDLTNVNYIMRKNIGSDGFEFKLMLYPSNHESFVYINQITSYVFYDSNDEVKNEMLRRFALYLLSYEAQRYTENIGMLPCADIDLDYRLYEYLGLLNDGVTRYTYREFEKDISGGNDNE